QPKAETPPRSIKPILSQFPARFQALDQVLRRQPLLHLVRRPRRRRHHSMVVHHPRAVRPLLEVRHRNEIHLNPPPPGPAVWAFPGPPPPSIRLHRAGTAPAPTCP